MGFKIGQRIRYPKDKGAVIGLTDEEFPGKYIEGTIVSIGLNRLNIKDTNYKRYTGYVFWVFTEHAMPIGASNKEELIDFINNY